MPRLVVNLRDQRPLWALPDWAMAEIRAALPPTWEVVDVAAGADGRGDGGPPSDEALAAIRGAEAYLGYGFPRPLFEAARAGGGALRWVHSAAAGVGGALYPEMRDSDVRLTNSAGVHAEPMAETVIGALLHFARGLDLAVRAQAARRWDRAAFEEADSPVREVAGTTLGVVGYGGIGRAVARRALPLGMRVLALRRRPAPPEPAVEALYGPDGLDDLLRRSDHVVVTLPETPETRGLIGRRELALLRPDAVLVNVGRGPVVDEAALVEALRARAFRGAALDVFAREPLPDDSPLWTLPNVLITPHVSATTRGYWRRQVDLILENLRRYLAGEPLRNEVDRRAGY